MSGTTAPDAGGLVGRVLTGAAVVIVATDGGSVLATGTKLGVIEKDKALGLSDTVDELG